MGGKIKLLGEPAIFDEKGQMQPLRGHQAWAVLARTLLARAPIERRSLAAELFPEASDPLGALRWCLASLRKALNLSDCLLGDPVECALPPGFAVDVFQLESDDFDFAGAGPLLSDIEPRSSPEFATWLLIERARVSGIIDARLRRETLRALSLDNSAKAVELAQIAIRRDAFNESAHVLLVKSLTLGGSYETALAHVDATERVFLAELGEKPSPALRSAARRTISAPAAGIPMAAFVTSLIQSGLAALSAGAVDAGLDCLRRAVHDAEKIKDKPLLAKAALELGTALVHAVRGFDDEGAVLLRQSTELARHTGSARIAASGYRELGYVEALAGRRPAAAVYLAEALNCAQDRDNLAGIHAVTGFNLVDWGKENQGLEHYHQSLEHARMAGNRRREIWSLGLGALGLLGSDDLDTAEDWLQKCLSLVEEHRWVSFKPWPVALLGQLKLRQRQPPENLRAPLEEAYALSCQVADPCWEAAVARTLALTHASVNDFDTAATWLGEARKLCFRHTDGYAALEVEILASQVDVGLKQGRPEMADAFAREWISLAARTHMDRHVARAAAFIAR